MTILRKSMMLLGSITLVVLMLAALTPKAARGVAAALVQIANTDASPVPTEDPARHAVALVANGEIFAGGDVVFKNEDGSAFSVPPGKRLVIEQVAGQINFTGLGEIETMSINGSLYGLVLTPPSVTSINSLVTALRFSQSLRFYSDSVPHLDFGNVLSATNGDVFATASGYLVDCTGACQ